ncbi:GL19097 [Drosophila persimilis]|uniref:GL19097 n=1 Tax=Drosophila persimilis TaxID=7234 RepID=B4G6S5_DROPE|nr:formin-like protein 20 [Drosophila persimilis]XP_026844489.1 formin-like protein 20 [Drosophila persimilis]XP_026844490.1 formin-like protein 20 [Drosophila persimilis]EDW28244.1 GL19097 [Drosophila persimilis]
MDKYSQCWKIWLWLWMAFALYGVSASEDRTIRLPAADEPSLGFSGAKDLALPISVASAVVDLKKKPPVDLLHRSKRTLTTICVEIKPSGPLEEPYYMCKGENFGTENKQSCVEFKPGGAQGELYYMCKGNDFASGNDQGIPANQPSQFGFPSQKQAPPAVAPGYQQQAAPIAHTFPSFPAFGGGLFPNQQQYEEPRRETPTTTYQEQRPNQQGPENPQQQPYNAQQKLPNPQQPPQYPQEQPYKPQQQPQNAPQQQLQYPEYTPQQPHQPHQQFGYSGGTMAPTPAASPAQSYGLPAVPRPNPGSPPALQYGAPAGPGPTATTTAYHPAAAQKSAAAAKPTQGQQQSIPSYETPVVGSRHQPGLDGDVVGMPRVGFQPEEFRQQYRGSMGEPPMQQQELAEPQMVWLPPSPVAEQLDDPVMRSFYKSLAPQPTVRAEGVTVGAAPPTVGAPPPPLRPPHLSKTQPVPPLEPLVGQSYQPSYGQYPESQAPPTLPPPPPAYSRPEVPASTLEPSPIGYNSYCNGCNVPSIPRQCPAETGVSYSTICPSFQPVIIAMPCYEQQPTHYLAVPNIVPNGGRIPSTYGNEMPGGSPYGSSFGMHQQVGSPYGANQQVGSPFGANQQVGSPFGIATQIGRPFGPNQQVGSPFGQNQQVGSPFGANQQVGSPFGTNQQVGSPFGTNQQMGSPFGNPPQVGSPFGNAPQSGSPFGMAPQMGNNPGFNMNMGAQVGSPFVPNGPQVGAGFGMGLSPFGPFGSLNPFNPFNRILGAAAPTTPQPQKNGFQRIFKFDSSSTTTEAPSLGSTVQQSTEKSGKLNFSSSTPTAAPSSASSEPSLGASLAGPAEEDEHEEDDEGEDEDHMGTTTASTSEADTSVGASLEVIPLGKLTAKDLMNKAEESLKTDDENPLKNEKRKRHNSRANKGINQKRKYLQQL